MFASRAAIALCLLVLPVGTTTAGPERLAEVGDAFVEADRALGRWSIGNDAIRWTVEVDSRGTLSLDGLRLADGTPVTLGHESDSRVSLDGLTTRLGAAAGPLRVESVDTVSGAHQLELRVHLTQAQSPLRAVRHYLMYPRVPTIEVWTSFESRDTSPTTTMDLNAFDLDLPAGTVRFVSGLESPEDGGVPFTPQRRELGDSGVLQIGSDILSSTSSVPAFAIDHDGLTVSAALAWSGAWSAAFHRTGDVMQVSMGLPQMSAWVTAGQPVSGPHAIIGAMRTAPGAEAAAWAAGLRVARDGRPYPSLSTFNPWFIYGARTDQALIRRTMFYAERADIELFQLDAGWYPRDGASSTFDFTTGLGSWRVDETRFPDGLGALGDYSRRHGMQFAIWVEPERVALSTVGKPGLAEERFLATANGAYHPGLSNSDAVDGQICLGDKAAREWLWAKLVGFIDEARPDYLKWDYNRFLICNRPGHGHPVDGGNFAHVQGLYELLTRLRAQYPRLIIENCSGGGRRLDLAMARLTDVGWMDDRTTPSRHVRRNLAGLSTVFPASYLLSYIMPSGDEPLGAEDDVTLASRSRLPGTVGLSVNFDELSEVALGAIHRDIKLAALLRPVQSDAVTIHLAAPADDGHGWDVVEQISAGSGRGLVFAFDDRSPESFRLTLQRLRPTEVYEVRSIDHGLLGRFSGATLSDVGLELEPASGAESSAHVLTFDPVSLPDRRR